MYCDMLWWNLQESLFFGGCWSQIIMRSLQCNLVRMLQDRLATTVLVRARASYRSGMNTRLNMYLSCGNVAWWHLFDCASWSSLTLPRLLSQRSEQQQTHEQSWNQLQNCMCIVKAWGVSPPKMASATCITSLKWKGCCKVAVETFSNWLPGAIGWVSGNLLSQVLQDHDITMTQKIELTLQSLPMFFHGSLAISIWLKASL